MDAHRGLVAWMILCALSLCLSAGADRPSKKMIAALTAIDVGAGVERIEYRASLPWMICQALVYSGVKTDYASFCTVSGWSAEFHYDFDKQWIAYLSLQGLPSGRCFSRGVGFYGRELEMFAWPEQTTEEERLLAARAAWDFAIQNIADDKPVLCDYMDGGVFYGYDQTLDDPAIYFSTHGPGFGALHLSTFNDVFGRNLRGLGVLSDADDEAIPDDKALLVGVLANLLVRAYQTETDGCAAGIVGMNQLAADLLNPERDWGENAEWLCWPLSNQTETRLCTAVYLRRNAGLLGAAAETHVLAAANHYEEAFGFWRERWEASWLTDGERDERPNAERMADAGRREEIAGWVHKALGAEALGLAEARKALAAME